MALQYKQENKSTILLSDNQAHSQDFLINYVLGEEVILTWFPPPSTVP